MPKLWLRSFKSTDCSGKSAQTIRDAPKFGVTGGRKNDEPAINFKQVHKHVQGVIDTIAPMDSVERFEALGVTVIKEHARFLDKNTVVAGGVTIKARRIVVATGSGAFVPPIPGLDKVDYLTNENIFERTSNPGHLIVIGGGPIGMEMAQAHRRLGAKVTVIEGSRPWERTTRNWQLSCLIKFATTGL